MPEMQTIEITPIRANFPTIPPKRTLFRVLLVMPILARMSLTASGKNFDHAIRRSVYRASNVLVGRIAPTEQAWK